MGILAVILGESREKRSFVFQKKQTLESRPFLHLVLDEIRALSYNPSCASVAKW